MPEDTIISTGVPAVETLQTADAALSQYSPDPKQCAGSVDAEFYTTNDIAIGYLSETSDDTHSAQTVVTAGFETAQQATEYFDARSRAWSDCSSVDLTIDDTNALTLQYTAHTFTDSDDVTASESLLNADQDLVLTSAGELSGEFKADDTAVRIQVPYPTMSFRQMTFQNPKLRTSQSPPQRLLPALTLKFTDTSRTR